VIRNREVVCPHRTSLRANGTIPSRVVPVFELVGDTNTATGKTDLALQPEVIYRSCKHVELKVGLPLGLTSSSPGIGIRTQLAILWDR